MAICFINFNYFLHKSYYNIEVIKADFYALKFELIRSHNVFT